jgi:NitT/TauT family transport system substrate-binding protein
MDDVLNTLGIKPVPALVGFIWREETEASSDWRVAQCCRGANTILASSDAAWGASAAS